ncbi:hypothetical protein Tco_1568058 [Tanacetum coccineum]
MDPPSWSRSSVNLRSSTSDGHRSTTVPKFTLKLPSRQKLVLPKSGSDDDNEEDVKIARELLRKANEWMAYEGYGSTYRLNCNQVLNPKPLFEFNPSIGHVVKSAVDKPKDVTDKVLAENECVQFVCLVWCV